MSEFSADRIDVMEGLTSRHLLALDQGQARHSRLTHIHCRRINYSLVRKVVVVNHRLSLGFLRSPFYSLPDRKERNFVSKGQSQESVGEGRAYQGVDKGRVIDVLVLLLNQM